MQAVFFRITGLGLFSRYCSRAVYTSLAPAATPQLAKPTFTMMLFIKYPLFHIVSEQQELPRVLIYHKFFRLS